MPAIYIEHEDHGRHAVYTNAELDWHKAKGWKIVEDKPVEPTVTKAEAPKSVVTPRKG